jgi:hypothetical protein
MTGRGVVGLVVAAAVGAAVAAGLVLMGSPGEARARRLDARRVSDLAQIARNIDLFWTRRAELPATLAELSGELGLGALPVDPETGNAYRYSRLEGSHYEICAEFARESAGEPPGPAARFWVHGRGLACFEVAAETVEREPGRRGSPPESGPPR